MLSHALFRQASSQQITALNKDVHIKPTRHQHELVQPVYSGSHYLRQYGLHVTKICCLPSDAVTVALQTWFCERRSSFEAVQTALEENCVCCCTRAV